MDLAQTLIRSVVRSFYTPEYILIIDAVIMHSALRDDDLAFLMGSQTKHTRKLCSRLRDDGLLNVQSRPEIKPGANKAFNRDYYFINFHRAIDIVKYRLKSMTREIEKRFGQTAEEKKDYSCPRCKSEYTVMEVLDSTDFASEFICKRCGGVLVWSGDEAQNSAGHEMQSRLNAQLAAFELLMRKIDDVEVPENDFEAAIANARPVIRDQSLNPGVRSEAVVRANMPAATVHGMRTEQDKIQVSLHDASQAVKQEAEEAERKARLAEQNALPAWHTTSTVTGERTELGMREEAMRREREANGMLTQRVGEANDADEEKKPVEALQDNSQLDAYFAAVREDEAKRNLEEQEDDEDDEDEDEDDEDEDDFEDVAIGESGNASPAKRLKLDKPVKNGDTNGVPIRGGDVSVATSVASESTPASSAPAPKQEPGESSQASHRASNDVSAEDSDEDDFEDAL